MKPKNTIITHVNKINNGIFRTSNTSQGQIENTINKEAIENYYVTYKGLDIVCEHYFK